VEKYDTYLMTRSNDILYLGKIYKKIFENNFRKFEVKEVDTKKIVQVPNDVFKYWQKKLKNF